MVHVLNRQVYYDRQGGCGARLVRTWHRSHPLPPVSGRSNVTSELTDTWIDEARRGSELAVRKLLAAYHPTLRQRVSSRMDPRIKSRIEPDDVLQHVYMEVFRRISAFQGRGPDSFLNWVLTIADSKLADAHRLCFRQKRDLAREQCTQGQLTGESIFRLVDHAFADSLTPSRLVRRDEATAAVVACLAGLPAAHRDVLQFRFVQGLSVAEVAERFDKSESSVVALTKRALTGLRKSMDELGEFTQGA